jgi:predicted aspartyl protease
VGTFYLNGHPILILFDSGATRDFISKTCTQKYQMTIESIKTPYMIRTLGRNIITKQVVMNALLDLVGKLYKTHLIVLDGQGIDVILGMSWIKERRALLDIASRTV